MTGVGYKLFDFLNYNGLESQSRRAVAARKRTMTTPTDSIPIADLAGALLNGPLTMARVRLALHVAVQRGFCAALTDEIARLESSLANDRLRQAPDVEFPIPDRDSDRHVRVISGTGNAAERREMDALCRALGTQP